MKSDVSRFLHHTLSHSGIREVFTYSLSLSDLIGESRSNKFANWFYLDHRVKPDDDNIRANTSLKHANDSVCTGRSMVEMLGVLAIIGVLSVGAIAGYSKAMFKYRLNKHAESFSMLLNNALQLTEDLTKTVKKTSYINSAFFAKANLLPDGMNYTASDDRIHDIFNNKIWIYYNNYLGTYSYVMRINMERTNTKISNRSREICRGLALTTKEYSLNIYSFGLRSNAESKYTEKNLYGGLSSFNTNLLQNATLKQIDDICASCDSEIGCEIIIMLNVLKS